MLPDFFTHSSVCGELSYVMGYSVAKYNKLSTSLSGSDASGATFVFI